MIPNRIAKYVSTLYHTISVLLEDHQKDQTLQTERQQNGIGQGNKQEKLFLLALTSSQGEGKLACKK